MTLWLGHSFRITCICEGNPRAIVVFPHKWPIMMSIGVCFVEETVEWWAKLPIIGIALTFMWLQYCQLKVYNSRCNRQQMTLGAFNFGSAILGYMYVHYISWMKDMCRCFVLWSVHNAFNELIGNWLKKPAVWYGMNCKKQQNIEVRNINYGWTNKNKCQTINRLASSAI